MVGVKLLKEVSPRFDFGELPGGMRCRFFQKSFAFVDWHFVQPGRVVSASANEVFNQRGLQMGRLIFPDWSAWVSGGHAVPPFALHPI